MTCYAHYREIARLFDFPESEYGILGRGLLKILREDYPDAADKMARFLDGLPKDTLAQQELYTRTFDVQAITTLDIGYVLFGDDYKRAELLSNLTREHKKLENDCGLELADHLPNVLRLIAKLSDSELLSELVSEILIPALMLMIREFDSERMEKKSASYEKHYKTVIESAPGKDPAIYCLGLSALLSVLAEDFQVSETIAKLSDWSSRKGSADFLGLVEKEMEIENRANPVNSGCDS